MKKSKQALRFAFIDDDKDNHRQWLEWARGLGHVAAAFESVFDANRFRADFFIIDVSATCPMMLNTVNAYSPIAALQENHPGATIVVGSCMSRNAVEEILDRVEEVTGQRPLFFDASEGFRGLEKLLSSI